MSKSSREPIEPELVQPKQIGDADLERLARLMDSAFVIPGTGIRFGLDALIGLIPGLGDTLTSAVSLYILTAAARYQVPRVTLVRMAANIGIDYVIGAVPFLGDLFDVFWKSNQKNVALLQKHLQTTPAEERKAKAVDWLFVGLLIFLLIALLVGCVFIAVVMVNAMWLAASSLWK